MRAGSGVLGVAAAAAFSSAAIAGPCIQTSPIRHVATGPACALHDKTVSSFIYSTPNAVAAESVTGVPMALTDNPGPSHTSDSVVDVSEALTGNASGADAVTDAETFSGSGVKITRLQATMTANTYVAGVVTFAPPVQQHFTDDVTLYTPDYLAVKGMSPTPKRPPSVVGVGLSTAPSQNAKTSDTAPKGEYLRKLPLEWTEDKREVHDAPPIRRRHDHSSGSGAPHASAPS